MSGLVELDEDREPGGVAVPEPHLGHLLALGEDHVNHGTTSGAAGVGILQVDRDGTSLGKWYGHSSFTHFPPRTTTVSSLHS